MYHYILGLKHITNKILTNITNKALTHHGTPVKHLSILKQTTCLISPGVIKWQRLKIYVRSLDVTLPSKSINKSG